MNDQTQWTNSKPFTGRTIAQGEARHEISAQTNNGYLLANAPLGKEVGSDKPRATKTTR